MTITDAIVTTGFKWAFKEYFTTKNKIEKKSNHVLLKKQYEFQITVLFKTEYCFMFLCKF